MSAFTWLNDLMRWLGRWFPRLTLIPATHRGVLFGRAGRVTDLAPGLVVYWPLVSQLAQVIGDRLIALVILWRVRDAGAAVCRYRDVESRLENTARTLLPKHIAKLDELQSSDGVGFAFKKFTDSASRETQTWE